MSLLYRDSSGNETPIAGLNGLSGELIYGASTVKSGTNTNVVGTTDAGFETTYTVTFDSPMPDANYTVVLSPLSAETTVSFLPNTRTVNGFQYYLKANHNVSGNVGAIWSAFELYSVERLEAMENDITDLQSYAESDYKHYTKNVYDGDVIKISGFRALSSYSNGETFILRQRGGETLLLSLDANNQDINVSNNYMAFRLYKGFSKITRLVFDYVARELYVTVASYGALSISQICGDTDTLELTTNATIPNTNVYTIPIIDATTQSVETIAPTNHGYTTGNIVVRRNGKIVTVSFTSLLVNANTDGLNMFTGLPMPYETVYGSAYLTTDPTKSIHIQVISYAGTGVFRMTGGSAGSSYNGHITYIASN